MTRARAAAVSVGLARSLAPLLALAVALAPLRAAALEGRVEGTLVDGTNGGEGRAEFVHLVNLSGNMEGIGGTENAKGVFKIAPVTAEPGQRLLVRATRQGIAYNEMIVFDPSGLNVVEVTVYDTTSAMDGARIVRYQVGLAAETDVLRVFKIWEIEVGGAKPRTVVAKPGAFRFFVQPDLLQIRSATARSGTMPLNVEAIPLEGGAGYTFDYPLRPGQTEIQLAYDIPYREIGTNFSEALMHPVEEMNVLVVPRELTVASELLSDRGIDDENGIHMFSGRDLPKDTRVSFRLEGKGSTATHGGGEEGGDGMAEGGDEESGVGGPGGNSPRVMRVANRTQKLLVPAVAAMLAPLAAGVAYALARKPVRAKKGERRAADPATLAKREAILDRIVAIDRKHRAGEISDYAYWQKREALKDELVQSLEEIGRGPKGAG